jgi:branched-chain amino acid transport system substrate-binding protein
MRRLSAKTFRLAAMTTASAAVAACGLSSAAPTNSLLAGPSGEPIVIGVSEPLSGPQQAQGFAADGQACLRGYELWASDVNSHGGLLGRPVRLKVLNDKGDIGLTKANYRTLITQDHVDLTLAPFSSLLVAQAAGLVTQQYKYVLAAGQAGAPAVYALHDPYLFSTTVPVKQQLVPFANWVSNLPPGQRPATAAYPYVNNPFAQPPVQAAQKIMANHGIRTVYTTPGQGYNDLSAAALGADARKVVAANPGIVVLGSVDVPTVQAFIQDFIAQKWNPTILIAAAGPDQGQAFINAIGGPANSVGLMVPNGWFGNYPDALSHVMVQDYIAKYGGTADAINADVAESYSAGEVLAAAVAATRGLNQQAIANWLHGNTVQTVVGKVKFDQNGENTNALQSAVIFQWQPNEQFVQVLGRSPGNKAIISPKPPWGG